MSLDPISALLGVAEAAVRRIWPDPERQAIELRKLAELEQAGDLAQLSAHVQLMLGQVEVNKVEAGSGSLFVAGWRPWLGWTCGTGLFYQFVLYPLLLWIWAVWGPDGVAPPPPLDPSMLLTLITGMLGVGAMRSIDKRNGVATHGIRKES